MKKLSLLIALLFVLGLAAPAQAPKQAAGTATKEEAVKQPEKKKETNVVICNGKTAYAYHKDSKCKGLKNCKGGTKTVTLEKAKEMGRKPCGYCYKK